MARRKSSTVVIVGRASFGRCAFWRPTTNITGIQPTARIPKSHLIDTFMRPPRCADLRVLATLYSRPCTASITLRTVYLSAVSSPEVRVTVCSHGSDAGVHPGHLEWQCARLSRPFIEAGLSLHREKN